MAISPTTGGTVSNSTAGTSLAFAANTTTTGQYVVVAVSIDSASVTVSSVTDLGSNSYSKLASVQNGSVRSELWGASNITGHTNNVITVNLSGSSLASAAYEEYSGVTAFGNTSSNSGSSFYPSNGVLTQDGTNWVVSGMAVGSNSGDTYTATWGTIRQSIIPALTTTSTGLVDGTSVPTATIDNLIRLSASRVWAATSVELRTGSGALSPTESSIDINILPQIWTEPAGVANTPSFFLVTPVAAVIQGGTVGTIYSETINAVNGTSPYTFLVVSGSLPTGLTLTTSTGVISGTPTATGTSSFTIRATDTNGFTGTQNFSITIAAASGGSGGNFGFVA